ncbi:MAG: hypothetical protein HBSAPP03_04940 [Phycisphaerae bacterium]|nr:MAG: hypothetical protein HBSAPP03_04940 [Phycisphaerae bacterium]
MATTFKGLNLFNSGPHRVEFGPRGHLVTIDFFGGGSGGGSTAQGLTDWTLVVRGRLVATSESALHTLREAVRAQLQATPTAGTFIDHHGHSWSGLTFVRYAEHGPADRGRAWSVAYEAVFQAL